MRNSSGRGRGGGGGGGGGGRRRRRREEEEEEEEEESNGVQRSLPPTATQVVNPFHNFTTQNQYHRQLGLRGGITVCGL